MASEIILPGHPAFGNNNLWALKSGSTNTYQAIESVGGALKTVSSVDQTSDDTRTVQLAHVNRPSYVQISQATFDPGVTPTDMLTISNPAGSGKVLRLVILNLGLWSTVGALQSIYWVKRSSANTGGTLVDISATSAVPHDSNDPAAVGVVRVYSAAPASLGTSMGLISFQRVLSTVVTTAVPGVAALGTVGVGSGISVNKSLVLRPGQLLAANYNGAAKTAGLVCDWSVMWTEEDA